MQLAVALHSIIAERSQSLAYACRSHSPALRTAEPNFWGRLLSLLLWDGCQRVDNRLAKCSYPISELWGREIGIGAMYNGISLLLLGKATTRITQMKKWPDMTDTCCFPTHHPIDLTMFRIVWSESPKYSEFDACTRI